MKGAVPVPVPEDSRTLSPSQKVVGPSGVMVGVGFAFTVTTMVFDVTVLRQPPSVSVTSQL